MKKIILLLLMGMTAQAQNHYFEIYNDSAALKNQNDKLIAEIEKRLQLAAPTFSFNGLTTEIPNKFMPGQYRQKTNKIYLNTWQVGGPPMEKFLTDVGGNPENGKSMAALFFYGFFLPHEIGHALHYQTGQVPENNYDSEYEANEIAVAYWRSQGKEKELRQCYETAKKVLLKVKNPVPENADPKAYITAHYNELLQDPYKYAYIQFSQIVKIMEDPSLPDFDAYVKKYLVK